MSKRDRASDTPTHSERTVSWRVCKTFFPMLWQHRHTLAASYFFSLLAVGAVVLIPWPLKLIIDQALIQQPLPGFLARLDPGVSPAAMVIILASAAAVIAMLGAIFSALEKNINARVRERMARDLRDELLRHIQTLPLTLRNSQRSGELGLRLVDDVHHVVRLLTKTVPVIFRHMATMVVIFTVMFWLEPLLGLLGVCVVALLAWFVRHYAGPLRDVSQQKRHYEGEVAGLTQEIIRGMHSVQAQGMEETVRERFAAMNTRSLNAGVEETRVAVGMERVMQITNGIAVALFVGGGGLLVLQNHLTVGGLTVYAAYIVQLLKPVEKINEMASAVARGLARSAQLLALLDHRPLVQDLPGALHIDRAGGRLELQSVAFAYPTDSPGREDKLVLDGINLCLEPGTLTVLVGPSGSGKSTLLNLLLRLFDPSSGEIILDGIPYTRIQLQRLRAQFAVMLQATHLFAGTVRSALQSGHQRVSDEKLFEVLKQVALDDFVHSLPDGLNTVLGEDCVNLSGGQRARLSLARALLLDRPILLLDEPLANVDSESQEIILDALDRTRARRTCLAVSHQPALVRRADVVLQLEHGRITPLPVRSARTVNPQPGTGA